MFRLPVTWTEFVQDSEPFTIDWDWLEAVKTEVDYILSKGAYCILNMHDDYMIRSFVGDHWEDAWMLDQYKDYVDARFTAIWAQIADFFKDYPPTLIFETANEPAMLWDLVYPYHPEISMEEYADLHNTRNNELNQMLLDTVRNSGGQNGTRILCLSVGNYNSAQQLDALDIPDDPYVIAQLHSYQEMENNGRYDPADYNFDYVGKTNSFFEMVSAFTARTGVPVLIGEVGVSHKLTEEERTRRLAYYFQQCESHGTPALWWEDYFITEDGYYYWIYDLENKQWETGILEAILDTYDLDIGSSLASPEIVLANNPVPYGENLIVELVSLDPGAEGLELYVLSSDNRTAYWDYEEYTENGKRMIRVSTASMPMGRYRLMVTSRAEGCSPGYASIWFEVTVNGTLTAPGLQNVPTLIASGEPLQVSFDPVPEAETYTISLLYCGENGDGGETVYQTTVQANQEGANQISLEGSYLLRTGKYRLRVTAAAKTKTKGTAEVSFRVVQNTEQGITLMVEDGRENISDWPARKDFSLKVIAQGAAAIRYLDINGNWVYQNSSQLNNVGMYKTLMAPDAGEYIFVAQAAYDEGIDWDSVDTWNFDWQTLNWTKTSNEVSVSVTSAGIAEPAEFVVPEEIVRGELLNVVITGAGNAESPGAGNRFSVYLVNEWGSVLGNTIDTGVIDAFPVTVAVPTGDMEEETLRVCVVSSRAGYNANVSEPREVSMIQSVGSQDIVFNVQENIFSGVRFSASAWAPGAGWMTMWVRDLSSEESDLQDWGNYGGSSINNPWMWLSDPGTYEFYVVAHYVDEHGNEQGQAESEHITRTAVHSRVIEMPTVHVPSVTPAGQRLCFRVEGLDQEAVGYWDIRINDFDGWNEIAFWSIADFVSTPEAFFLSSDQISAGGEYQIGVWMDDGRAEGKFYSISFRVSDRDGILWLPEDLETVEMEAFSGSGASTVVIPQGMKTIEGRAFSSCASLDAAYIPDSVTSIGQEAFSDQVTIYAPSGSFAEDYASENGLSFVPRK